LVSGIIIISELINVFKHAIEHLEVGIILAGSPTALWCENSRHRPQAEQRAIRAFGKSLPLRLKKYLCRALIILLVVDFRSHFTETHFFTHVYLLHIIL